MEIYILVILLMTIITASFYAVDKAKAEKKKWRIKEATLLLLSLCFGSLGGLFGLYVLRHKNKHWYFVVVNFLALVLHIIIGYYVYKYIGLIL